MDEQRRSRCWLHVAHSPSFRFQVEQTITVGSIHVQLAPETTETPPGDGAALEEGTQCLLWAKCITSTAAADGVLCDQTPYVVASLCLNAAGSSTASSLAWNILEGTLVSVCITKSSEAPMALQEAAADSPTRALTDSNGDVSVEVSANSSSFATALRHKSITVTLLGVETDWPSQQSMWRPLLCFRWFELQEHIRAATVVSQSRKAHWRGHGKHKRRMLPGDVAEATAVSTCGTYTLWRDGTVGLRRELVPYYRVFTPSSETKRVRVRVFPHRFADIVGEVPFGRLVEAIGHEVDPYTMEQYALLLLSGTPDAAVVAETCSLHSVAPNTWVWGWSKIATSNGLLLLKEVTDTTQPLKLEQDYIEQLHEPTYYTSVREERSVRIRNGPSLSAGVVAHLEPNEVKLSTAIHHTSVSQRGASAPLVQHFVKWDDGGFSLLRNDDRVYLVPIQLQSQPCQPAISPPLVNVTSPNRKRERSATPNGEQGEPETADTSPQRRHGTSREDAGSVPVGDMPIIQLNGSSARSSSSSDAHN
ncbi:hypothetical protein DQ04_00181020 [Trypanosoma grayi]|uniref:hypothetical protein n=1 Tax=Trypanosoma grayi TaxID=71804 RepID=UPI0004F45446|nr:hypothetical protein DQ04_00181020 [Trypanosoma grayi]KEG15109.1 hypothetical protein DQ04_00181020 [Trypanosoma grayi]